MLWVSYFLLFLDLVRVRLPDGVTYFPIYGSETALSCGFALANFSFSSDFFCFWASKASFWTSRTHSHSILKPFEYYFCHSGANVIFLVYGLILSTAAFFSSAPSTFFSRLTNLYCCITDSACS